PLPVKLESFKTSMSREYTAKVLVEWSTSSEMGSDRFIVERSADSRVWVAVGEVAAKGKSEILNVYTLYDLNPVTGTNYYRLTMVDRDGSSEHSLIRTVVVTGAEGNYLYPNPAINTL